MKVSLLAIFIYTDELIPVRLHDPSRSLNRVAADADADADSPQFHFSSELVPLVSSYNFCSSPSLSTTRAFDQFENELDGLFLARRSQQLTAAFSVATYLTLVLVASDCPNPEPQRLHCWPANMVSGAPFGRTLVYRWPHPRACGSSHQGAGSKGLALDGRLGSPLGYSRFAASQDSTLYMFASPHQYDNVLIIAPFLKAPLNGPWTVPAILGSTEASCMEANCILCFSRCPE